MADLSGAINTVLDFYPGPEDKPVPSIPVMKVFFSGPMVLGSLNTDEKVSRGMSLLEEDSQTPIPLKYIDYSTSQKVLSVSPLEPLSPNIKYNVIIESKTTGFLSTGGKQLRQTKTFYFYVTEWGLPIPIPVSPKNGGLTEEFPSLVVKVPDFTAPTGSIVSLEYQVSANDSFDPPYQWSGNVAATGNVLHTILPVVNLATNNDYYWRARLSTTGIAGSWMPIQNFYYGNREKVNKDSRRNIQEDNTNEFFTSQVSFEDGTGNLQSWPDITLSFNKDLPNTEVSGSFTFSDNAFAVYKESVDGGSRSTVNGTWTMIDPRTVVFTPQETLLPLTRYTVVVKDDLLNKEGFKLNESLEAYFTGPYRPLYALPIQLQSLFGSLIQDTSEDLLYYDLYRSSLEANRIARIRVGTVINPYYFFNEPSTQQLQLDNYDYLYVVHMWTIDAAMIRVLKRRLYETIPATDGKLQIGDFSQNLASTDLLKTLKELILDLKKEMQDYELHFNRGLGKVRTGSKSSTVTSRIRSNYDFSTRKRNNF